MYRVWTEKSRLSRTFPPCLLVVFAPLPVSFFYTYAKVAHQKSLFGVDKRGLRYEERANGAVPGMW
jgi:hypothetical protein